MANENALPPTARKLRQAREKGDVAKSRELTAAAVLSSGFFCLLLQRYKFAQLAVLVEKSFIPHRDFQTNHMLVSGSEALGVLLGLLLPVLLTTCTAALAAEAFQVGFHVNFGALAPDLRKLGFTEGFKRLLGGRGEGLFSGFTRMGSYVSAFALGLGLVVWRQGETVMNWLFQDTSQVIEVAFLCIRTMTEVMLGAVLLLGLGDMLWQRARRLKRLRMNVEEFRREMRETLGDPEIRAMRKQLHQEMTLFGLAHGVRKARVVIVGRTGVQGG